MTMIVEDGSAPEGANSLVDLDFADSYFGDRQNFDWDAVDKESALIRATAAVLALYRGQWTGERTYGRDQSLDWPRADAVDAEGNEIPDDEIPIELKQAVCEAALLEGQNPGFLTPVFSTAVAKKYKLGELEVEYDTSMGAAGTKPDLTIIDNLVSGLIFIDVNSSVIFPLRA